MKDFAKGRLATGLIVIATVVLAGVAVFTALKLYQLGQAPVAPNAPKQPEASTQTPQACEQVTFTIAQNSPTLTPTTPPGSTATLTPTLVEGTTSTPTMTLAFTNTNTPTAIITPPEMPGPPNCPAQAPEAPVLVSVTKSGSEAVLTWTKVTNATHYIISYGTSPNNFAYGVPNTGNVNTFTVGSLNANTKYYFTVYAVNDCQPSKGSAVLSTVAGTSTTATGELPNAGVSIPTIFGLFGGILFIGLAMLLAI